MRPVEGTILTVVRESAEAVAGTQGDDTLANVLDRAFEAACDSVEKTPQLLPVLDSVAKNAAFINMARERASTIAGAIRARSKAE